MPELPEVETIRRDLEPLLLGRTIRSSEQVEQNPEMRRYVALGDSVGSTVREVRRRGKYLLLDLGKRELVFHLGMTGRLGIERGEDLTLGHVRVRFGLDDGKVLFLNDPRRFGKVHLVSKGDYRSLPALASMGPEPLSSDFLLEEFSLAASKASNIKALLLGQRAVAGLGNIYADEALFQAGIAPSQGFLRPEESERLYRAIPLVLARAIENRGTTLRDYRDGRGEYGNNQNSLMVFGKTGNPCPRCGTPIEKTRVAQRGTHYCPTCQKIRA